jgi:site-specific recombinase XerD
MTTLVPSSQVLIEDHARPRRELFDLWKVHLKVSGIRKEHTTREYLYYGKTFCTWMGGRPLDADTLIKWMEYCQSGAMRLPTVNRMNTRVRSFLKFLHNCEYVRSDMSGILFKQKEAGPGPVLTFSEAEVEQMKQFVAKSTRFMPHLWLALLSYRTGMRLKDCCYLRKRDIHLDLDGPSYITIYPFKTLRHGDGGKCIIPLIPGTDVWQWLRRLWDAPRYKRADGIDDYIHQDATGLYEWKGRDSIRLDMNVMIMRSGLGTERTFKHFRASFASNLINSGANVALICKMTGHTNVRTLLKYLKPDLESLQAGLAKAFQYAADSSSGRSDSSALQLEYREDTES